MTDSAQQPGQSAASSNTPGSGEVPAGDGPGIRPADPPPVDVSGSATQSPSPVPVPRLVTVQGIQWEQVLDFTHLFRGFRLAINPVKIMAALLAIILIYVGGRLFDVAWGAQVYRGEMQQFASMPPEAFRAQRQVMLERRSDQLDRMLRDVADMTSTQREALRLDPAGARRAIRAAHLERFHERVKVAADKRAAADQATAASPKAAAPLQRTPAQVEQDDRRAAAQRLMEDMRNVNSIVGEGIFETLLRYETQQFNRIIAITLSVIRLVPPGAPGTGDSAEDVPGQGPGLDRGAPLPQHLWASDTIPGCIANMAVTGPRWLFTGTAPMQWRPENADTWGGWFTMIAYRLWYLACVVALALYCLLVLAMTGGFIARLSALELSGIDRPPLKEVFVFTFRRLGVLVRTPLMPLAILLGIGLVLAIGSLVGAIPWVGPIIVGAMLFVFLGVAFILMLLLLGVLGGFNLLYPAIAVEGADAFDAMSRSFAYAYARPWRLVFYTVAALIYGAITFLFASFAVYLILLLTHTFVGWGMNFFGANYGTYSGVLALDTLWPAPEFMRLVQPVNWWAMDWFEFFGAILLYFWVFLLISSIGAYVISYYFSSHTIMYLLLRRSVDGQGLREVYAEDSAG